MAGMWLLGPYRLDPVSFSLERGGDPVALQRRPFDLLLYLVARRDRVVSRDELLREVWGGLSVVDGAVSTAVYEVRAALGDLQRSGKERWIATVITPCPSNASNVAMLRAFGTSHTWIVPSSEHDAARLEASLGVGMEVLGEMLAPAEVFQVAIFIRRPAGRRVVL